MQRSPNPPRLPLLIERLRDRDRLGIHLDDRVDHRPPPINTLDPRQVHLGHLAGRIGARLHPGLQLSDGALGARRSVLGTRHSALGTRLVADGCKRLKAECRVPSAECRDDEVSSFHLLLRLVFERVPWRFANVKPLRASRRDRGDNSA